MSHSGEFEIDALLLNLLASPWSMMQDQMDVMVRVLARRYAGKRGWQDEGVVVIADQDVPRGSPVLLGQVAVMPLTGILCPRGNLLVDSSGFTSLEMWVRAFERLVADEEVKAIVFDVDSPGGNHAGVPEAAAAVFAARKQKPMVAVSNYLNASAAYFIASQAHQVVGAASSVTGSIGVYTIHRNLQAALEAEGIDVTTIFAGKYKAELHSGHPLSDEARAFVQSQVDLCYGQFTQAVARGRGVSQARVRSGYGEGRALCADDAFSAGLLDRIETLEQVIARLSGVRGRNAVLRSRMDPDERAAHVADEIVSQVTQGVPA